MEGADTCCKSPLEALEEAGLQVELFHVQHVRQIRGRKPDRNDSIRLACVCGHVLATPGCVPPQPFRDLRLTSRCRCSRLRDLIHKALDH